MDPSEIEFLAEQQKISIIPKFTSLSILHLISGDVGPFRAGLPVVVPIWIAINLRQRQKCRIVPPDWMNVEALLEKKEEEKNDRLDCPNNYRVLVFVLFNMYQLQSITISAIFFPQCTLYIYLYFDLNLI